MEIWQAVVLGAVQGVAEFLPISSSGHLLLIQQWFGIKEGAFLFTIMLHLGTLIPVIIVLFKDCLNVFKRPFNRFWLLVLATIPAGIVGLVAKYCNIDAFFEKNYYVLGITFLITAGLMIFSEVRAKKCAMDRPINVQTACIMGVGQALGTIPGISRSGATLSAGCLARVDRNENATFTFLMSIPTILAAVVLEVIDCVKGKTTGGIGALPLIFGMLTAMVVGYISIKFMLKIIKKANYKWFALYLVLISIATFTTYFVGAK